MFFLIILSFALLNIAYLISFFSISIFLKVTETHYFLGYYPNLIRFQIRNVTFNIGFYIPIVGLSPIYTLVDGKQRMKYPWEFAQHSLFKRFIATFGGAIGLLVTGVLIFIAQTYFTTEYIITKEEINKHGICPSERAIELGFLPGDKIIAVNGKGYQEFSELLNSEVLLAPETSYTILRNGKESQIKIKDLAQNFMHHGPPFISLLAPFEVSEVMPGSPADKAGIRPGDRITKVNEQPIIKFTEMINAFNADDDGHVSLLVERTTSDTVKVFVANVLLDYEKRIGIRPKELIQYTKRKNSLWQAIQWGSHRAFLTLKSNISVFFKVISRALVRKESLSGPIGIVDIFTLKFWTVTSFYAMWYVFWNLLPLPKSAFWEIIPLGYEGLTKKKYPYAAFRTSLILSWIVFGGFYVWVLVNDIIKLF